MENNKRDHFLQNFSLPKKWKLIKKNKNSPHSLLMEDGSIFQLRFPKDKTLKYSQSLAQAIGFKKHPLSVLDITAGWAKEAFLISQLGCQITAIESNPFVFYLVEESLEHNNIDPSQLKIKLDNSLNYLRSLKKACHYPDIIFMDPMFGGRKKSLSKKPLRILKELAGDTIDKQELFNLALLKAKNRVVVKRHKLDKPLKKQILCSFKGHSVCYDVFNPIGGEIH